jgi:hypothetical protein
LTEDDTKLIVAKNTPAGESVANRVEIKDEDVDHPLEIRSEAIARDLRNIFYCENFDFQPQCYGLPPVENVCKQWTKSINSFRAPSTHDCVLYASKSCEESNRPNSVYKVAKGDAVGVLKLAAGYPHQSYVCKNNI